ncbi:MAG: tRNA lysidine(34) synthetase TilS, partial [Candidatus Bipolaricaulota bacterium]
AWVHKEKLHLGKAGPAGGYRYSVPPEGEICLTEAGWVVRTSIVSPPVDPKSCGEWVAHVDLDTLAPPLEIRTRAPGDRFRPLGMGTDVRVSQLMSKAGLPRHLREGWPLLCDQRGVVWVVGVRLSEDHKVTANTQRVLRVEAVSEL